MKKYILIISLILIALFTYNTFSYNEYYIPKPKAKLKIDLPLPSTSTYKTDVFVFEYSNSAIIHHSDNKVVISYPDYFSSIVFNLKKLSHLDVDIYNFENSIGVHEKQGAYIDANIIKDTSQNIYGVLCYLQGNNIATSSQFFFTDSINYFVSGSLEYNRVVNKEIEMQTAIMNVEVLNFINSFKWSNISE